MPDALELVDRAFQALSHRSGYALRENQRHLALLLSDLIEQGGTGAFEAPTGLGKSLATLIPAIANAIVSKRRTVIATYTNILAEQYWRKDLPLALSLFEGEESLPRTQFLIGRQRYACLIALDEHAPDQVEKFQRRAELGIETEFRTIVNKPYRELSQLWSKVSTPPVCTGRMCPLYNECFYYKARNRAEKAEIVITNHSVVIQDALLARSSLDDEGMLGKYDFLILDEAHDFPQAATNGLEFELSESRMNAIAAIAGRLESTIAPLADASGGRTLLQNTGRLFKSNLEHAQKGLMAFGMGANRSGILAATPSEVAEHPNVKSVFVPSGNTDAQRVAIELGEACFNYLKDIQTVTDLCLANSQGSKHTIDSLHNYQMYLQSFGTGCLGLFDPVGVAVSHAGRNGMEPILRQDIIGLAEPLTDLIWSKVPYACLSATLAVDNQFDFFCRITGANPDFREVLPTPFDFGTQASLYVPKANTIPDPTIARREGKEEEYWRALAVQVAEIIGAVGGRTLALFHSRKEMEAVYSLLTPDPDHPIYIQTKSGVATVGDRFKENTKSSLFALRSFWTGFDAPGETLSCVILVRVPFEVPIDPPQIARMAYMQTQGLDPFMEYSLPNAKMMMRQGAGRLIRTSEDHGVIALLDPRLRTKRYGEQIIENLPTGMRTFDDIWDAVAWAGVAVDA